MKPSIPKGTRDFLPEVVEKRNFIFDSIRGVFEKYGFRPIETPAMENLETLTGKYGEEGDRLIFKVLQRDRKLENALEALLKSSLTDDSPATEFRKSVENQLSDLALRYDLTVPFARFVVQHQNELTFPFRRYQIQPVWRADRPQRGRYREFFQCDADVVGTDSLRCEAEFVRIIDEVFTRLNIPVEIRINNRKLLAALAEYAGEPDKLVAMTVAIDKLDKMPLEKVMDDLRERNFSEDSLTKVTDILRLAQGNHSNNDLLNALEKKWSRLSEAEKGISEMRFVLDKFEELPLKTARLRFDLSLARGLNYYTGAIFEVVPLTENNVGSICGGGRYDDLTGIFGMSGVSGVGISFGADRIYDVLESRDGFPEKKLGGTRLLFVNFGEAEADFCEAALMQIRQAGIRAELYPDTAKMKKQMKYANDNSIPFVALVGENEMRSGHITLKDMESGGQFSLPIDELIEKLA